MRRNTVPALALGCFSTPPRPAEKWSRQCSSSWTVDPHLVRKRKGRRANWSHSGNAASHPIPRVAAHLKHSPKFTQISRIEDGAKPRELHSSFHPATHVATPTSSRLTTLCLSFPKAAPLTESRTTTGTRMGQELHTLITGTSFLPFQLPGMPRAGVYPSAGGCRVC